MKKQIILPYFLCICLLQVQGQTPADYVNPFIGTSNFGATYPGAVAPSGMVSVVPYNVSKNEGNNLNTDVGCYRILMFSRTKSLPVSAMSI